VVAMVYNGTNSTIGYWRGKHDITNSVVAGAISGAVFKSTRGLRPMAISGGIVASVAGSWAVSLRSFWDWMEGRVLTDLQLFRKIYFESE
jgi:import inner membrane translocase subunit TIM23